MEQYPSLASTHVTLPRNTDDLSQSRNSTANNQIKSRFANNHHLENCDPVSLYDHDCGSKLELTLRGSLVLVRPFGPVVASLH
jgi:hypothetical protein